MSKTKDNKGLKIALIRKKFMPEKGGAEKVAAKFVEEFSKRGHEVTVFSEVFCGTENSNVKWRKVPRSGMPSLCKTASFHRQAQQVLSSDKLRDEFDIVYAMCRTYPVDVFRVTEQLHSEWLPIGYSPLARLNPRHSGILKLEKKALDVENVKWVVTNSGMVKQQIAERFGFPGENVRVVYNGVDHDTFYPADEAEKIKIKQSLQLDPDHKICLFAAGNFKIKGLSQAVQVIALLPEKLREDVRLLVVGGDKAEPFLKAAEQLGVAENLIFAGAQSNMRDYYAVSDILLYPSLYEPFSNVCLEAFACGLPVITTRRNGACEIVEDSVNGFVVNNADDVERMSHCLAAFLKLPAEARARFSASAVKVAAKFSWRRHADSLEEFFQEIVRCKCAGN